MSNHDPMNVATSEFIEMLELMTDAERVQAFDEIAKRYCIECGREKPANGHCYCREEE